VDNTDNCTNYFTMAVNNTNSRNMNLAILCDTSPISLVPLTHVQVNIQVNCTVRNTRVHSHVTRQSLIAEDPKGQRKFSPQRLYMISHKLCVNCHNEWHLKPASSRKEQRAISHRKQLEWHLENLTEQKLRQSTRRSTNYCNFAVTKSIWQCVMQFRWECHFMERM
jgi:hypothetical protein